MEPAAYLITGAMAAGKSSVAQALAERFARGAHVRGDQFRRAVVRGREEMTMDASPEAWAQLRLRYELAASVTDRYVEAGFVAVMQDVILGPILDEVIAMIRSRPLAVIVLAPSVDALTQREAARPKTGYGSITPADLDRAMRSDTPRRGLWLDSTSLTVDETVDEILARVDEAIV